MNEDERDKTLTDLRLDMREMKTALLGPKGNKEAGFIHRHGVDMKGVHARVGDVEGAIATRCASHAAAIEGNRQRGEKNARSIARNRTGTAIGGIGLGALVTAFRFVFGPGGSG